MRTAKRDSANHKSFTIAICPSDKYTPFYIRISYSKLLIVLFLISMIITYTVFTLKNTNLCLALTRNYQNVEITNNLQDTKVNLAVSKHNFLKDHIHKLKIQEEEIKELLSINFDDERPHQVDLYSYPMIATHKIVSRRGEFGRVLIDNNIVVEYFDDSDTPEAYQRAMVTSERIKSLLASKAPLKKFVLKNMGDKVVAYINNQVVFVVFPSDVKTLKDKLSTRTLAKLWLNNIKEGLANHEGQQSIVDRFPLLNREYRKKSSIYKTLYPSIDYPVHTVMIGEDSSRESIRNVDHLLKLAQQEVSIYKKSFSELKDTVQSYKTRFEYTPSIYPIKNTIVLSEFGWRVHPLLRRVRFHTGVDLPTWKGAPIFATATGTVTKTDWQGGYGNRIEIDHGYGFSTIYAHNSQNLVEIGQHVNKGQLIGLVGMTGLAQGDHCHYEVRFFDRPVNPIRFLNLNIFSASKNW